MPNLSLYLLTLIPISLMFQLSSGFNCSSITTQDYCQAYNCTFSNGTCTGNFSPTCNGNCFYVDAKASIPGDGSLNTPFRNVTEAFSKIQVIQALLQVYSVILLPTSDQDEFYLSGSYLFQNQATINLRPYIKNVYATVFLMQLNIDFRGTVIFNKIRFSTKPADYTLRKNIVFTSAVIVNIDDIIFQDLYAPDDSETGFINFDTPNIFKLTNVKIYNSPGFKFYSINYVQLHLKDWIIADSPYVTNMFNLVTKNLTLQNVLIKNVTRDINNQTHFALFEISPIHNIDPKNGVVNFLNVTIQNFQGRLLNHFNLKAYNDIFGFYTFQDFNARDIDLVQQNALLNLDGCIRALMNNTTFTNISNALMVIRVKGLEQTFTMQNSAMSDIVPPQIKDLRNQMDILNDDLVGLCLTISQSSSQIENVTFRAIPYNCLSLIDSSFVIKGISIDFTGYKVTPFAAWLDQAKVGMMMTLRDVPSGEVHHSSFIGNQYGAQKGAGIYIEGDTITSLLIKDSSFGMLKAGRGAAIYSEMLSVNIAIESSTFYSNEAIYEGGTIYLNPSSLKSSVMLSIKDSTFKENKAAEKGGAISVENSMLDVYNSKFISNTAKSGGALSGGGNTIGGGAKLRVINNVFQSNVATSAGGAMRLQVPEYLTELKDNIYIQNVAVASPQDSNLLLSNPEKFRINVYQITKYHNKDQIADLVEFVEKMKINNGLSIITTSNDTSVAQIKIPHKTGHSLNFLIEVLAVGSEGNVFQSVNEDQMRISFTDSQNYEIKGESEVAFSKGTAYLYNQPKLFGPTHTEGVLSLSLVEGRLPTLQGILSLNEQITIEFINCETGEIYSPETKSCTVCEPGWVSFGDPYTAGECKQCAGENYECLGGTLIAVNKGFWRSDIYSLNIMPCPIQSACLGGLNDGVYDPKGLCDTGYQGNLCNECAPGFAKSDGGVCISCKENSGTYIKFVLFSVSQLAFVGFVVRSYLTQSNGIIEETPREGFSQLQTRNAMLKIFVNFAQTFAILSHLDLQWPLTFNTLSNAVTQVVPSDKQGLPIDCFIELSLWETYTHHFLKFVLLATRPLIIASFIIGILVKGSFLNNKSPFQTLKTKIIVSMVLIGFLTQPGIIQMGLESFKCINIGSENNTNKVMQVESEVECGSSSYSSEVGSFIWPLFSIWAFVLPGILFAVTVRRKLNKERTFTSRYFLLFAGYREKHFYWEFWVYLRKTILLLFTLFTHTMQPDHRVWMILWTLVIMLVVQIAVKPYENDTLNGLETFALFSLCFVVGSEMFLVHGTIIPSSKTLAYCIIGEEKSDDRSTGFIILASLMLFAYILRFIWLMIRSYIRGQALGEKSVRILGGPKEKEGLTPKSLRKPTLEDIEEDVCEDDENYKKPRRVKKISDDLTSVNSDWKVRRNTKDSDLFITIERKQTSTRECFVDRESCATPH